MPWPKAMLCPIGLLSFFLAFLTAGRGVASEEGLPSITVHQPSSAGFSNTCMSVTQAQNGSLFVGSEDGVLEYDCGTWRRIRTPGHTHMRTVLALDRERVAFGGINEFGWLEPGLDRNWRIRMLSDSLQGRAPAFREVRGIFQLSHGLYFQCKEFLARWTGAHLQLYLPSVEISSAMVVGDTLLLNVGGLGLVRLDPKSIPMSGMMIPDKALLPQLGPDLFTDGNRAICLLPLANGNQLLGTRFKGLFELGPGGVKERLDLNAQIKPLDLFDGIQLRDGRIALGTLQGGVILLDSRGRLLHHIDRTAGLPDPMAIDLFQDAEGGLWCCGAEGLARLNLDQPYTVFSVANGLEGKIQCMTRHQGRLVVGTTRGVFTLFTDSVSGKGRFVRMDRVNGICWNLLSNQGSLLAVIGGHLVDLERPQDPPLLIRQPNMLKADRFNPRLAYSSSGNELHILERREGRWQLGRRIPGVQGIFSSMTQLDDGSLWLGSDDQQLLRITRDAGGAHVRSYGGKEGLAKGPVRVMRIRKNVLVLNGDSFLAPNADGILSKADWIQPPGAWPQAEKLDMFESEDGRIWGIFPEGLATASPGPGGITWDTHSFESAGATIEEVLPESDSRIWIGLGHKLLRFDWETVQLQAEARDERPLQLRSLVLDGVQWAGEAGGLRSAERLTSSGRSPVEIEVTCARLSGAGQQRFSFLLEGLDRDWTPWQNSGKRQITYLPPGKYRLRVRERHMEQEIRERTLASFVVPPPWHGYWWVRAVALGLLVYVVFTVARGRSRHLQRMNQALEAEVVERRRAERALRESETRYRGLVDQSRDAIFLLKDEQVSYLNAGFRKLFSLRETDPWNPGIRLVDLMEPEDRPLLRQALDQLNRGETPPKPFEFHGRSSGGRKLLTEASLTLIQTEQGPLVQGILRDVGERRALEEQLRQSQKMEAVGRLAGGVAHDFNNILVVILGQCDMLLMSLDDHDPLREELAQVRDAAQRAAQLTRQLLVFSRRQTLHPQQISLNTVLGDLEKMLRRVIGENIQIQMDLAPDLLKANVDPGQMDQVILNLSVNARDAMPGGGRLTLTTRNTMISPFQARDLGTSISGPHVLLSIRDTGVGMSQEVQDHLFEPFFTTKESGQGTGLGLATVYGIITQSDGTIRVVSEPGQGTCFEIYLPVVEGDSSANASGEKQDLAILSGQERILLVEDEGAVREVLARTLRNHGYQVDTAANGLEALTHFEETGEPELVLSDVVMPELGGYDLVQRLRDRGLTLPLVLMTGYTDRDLNVSELAKLDVTVLTKPFGPGALLREIRRRLDARTL